MKEGCDLGGVVGNQAVVEQVSHTLERHSKEILIIILLIILVNNLVINEGL